MIRFVGNKNFISALRRRRGTQVIRFANRKPRPETVIILTRAQAAYLSEFATLSEEAISDKQARAFRKLIEQDVAVMRAKDVESGSGEHYGQIQVAKRILIALERAGIA